MYNITTGDKQTWEKFLFPVDPNKTYFFFNQAIEYNKPDAVAFVLNRLPCVWDFDKELMIQALEVSTKTANTLHPQDQNNYHMFLAQLNLTELTTYINVLGEPGWKILYENKEKLNESHWVNISHYLELCPAAYKTQLVDYVVAKPQNMSLLTWALANIGHNINKQTRNQAFHYLDKINFFPAQQIYESSGLLATDLDQALLKKLVRHIVDQDLTDFADDIKLYMHAHGYDLTAADWLRKQTQCVKDEETFYSNWVKEVGKLAYEPSGILYNFSYIAASVADEVILATNVDELDTYAEQCAYTLAYVYASKNTQIQITGLNLTWMLNKIQLLDDIAEETIVCLLTTFKESPTYNQLQLQIFEKAISRNLNFETIWDLIPISAYDKNTKVYQQHLARLADGFKHIYETLGTTGLELANQIFHQHETISFYQLYKVTQNAITGSAETIE